MEGAQLIITQYRNAVTIGSDSELDRLSSQISKNRFEIGMHTVLARSEIHGTNRKAFHHRLDLIERETVGSGGIPVTEGTGKVALVGESEPECNRVCGRQGDRRGHVAILTNRLHDTTAANPRVPSGLDYVKLSVCVYLLEAHIIRLPAIFADGGRPRLLTSYREVTSMNSPGSRDISLGSHQPSAGIGLAIVRLIIGAMFVSVFFENLGKGLYVPANYAGLINSYIAKDTAPAIWKSVMALAVSHASIAAPLQ